MNNDEENTNHEPSAESLWAGRGLGVLLLIAAVVVAIIFVKTRPKETRRKPKRQAPVVEVMPLVPTNSTVVLRAAGTVIPAVEIDLRPEVSGRIVALHREFAEGGRVGKGDILVEIDQRDYHAGLQEAGSALRIAQTALALEEGKQDVARREWELLGLEKEADAKDRELALRVPQLKARRAEVAMAEAVVAKAKLAMERTGVKCPVNAVVASRNADVGDTAMPTASLARLVGTDNYWVRVSVRADEIRWLKIPRKGGEKGSPAVITLPTGDTRNGYVIRLLPDLEPQGRMARVLVQVDNPLGIDSGGAPMLLDSYVRVTITGKPVENVCVIPRTSFRNGGEVWLLDPENHLQINNAQPVWGDRDSILLKPTWKEGMRLVVSDLSTPIQGMSLRPAP